MFFLCINNGPFVLLEAESEQFGTLPKIKLKDPYDIYIFLTFYILLY